MSFSRSGSGSGSFTRSGSSAASSRSPSFSDSTDLSVYFQEDPLGSWMEKISAIFIRVSKEPVIDENLFSGLPEDEVTKIESTLEEYSDFLIDALNGYLRNAPSEHRDRTVIQETLLKSLFQQIGFVDCDGHVTTPQFQVYTFRGDYQYLLPSPSVTGYMCKVLDAVELIPYMFHMCPNERGQWCFARYPRGLHSLERRSELGDDAAMKFYEKDAHLGYHVLKHSTMPTGRIQLANTTMNFEAANTALWTGTTSHPLWYMVGYFKTCDQLSGENTPMTQLSAALTDWSALPSAFDRDFWKDTHRVMPSCVAYTLLMTFQQDSAQRLKTFGSESHPCQYPEPLQLDLLHWLDSAASGCATQQLHGCAIRIGHLLARHLASYCNSDNFDPAALREAEFSPLGAHSPRRFMPTPRKLLMISHSAKPPIGIQVLFP
jgi:hypothetical protein